MKSWMTTSSAIISVIIALWHCYQEGKVDVMCIVIVVQGAGLWAAKDFNVTGGTRAQDDKAGGLPAEGAAKVGTKVEDKS